VSATPLEGREQHKHAYYSPTILVGSPKYQHAIDVTGR
jgi:hypothetical protein